MNTLKLASAVTLILASAAASADILGVYAGAKRWNYDLDGTVRSGGNNIDVNRDLGLKDDDANIYYLAFEHPLPFLPNIRIQQNELDGNENGIASQDFSFQSGSYQTGDSVATRYDFSHTDYTLYYEILDNWVNLDLGFSAKDFDGFVDIRPDGQAIPALDYRVNLSGTVPLLYGRAQFDLPFTGWSAGGELQVGKFDDDDLTDASAYVAYEGDSGFGFELGYRLFELEFDDFDDLSSDLTIDGFYAGLSFHF
ncbi:TIGR04219 family outer membrane beta-barrel protein [Kangiella sp. TOML190]|uniref:TIGR04219 family outer membrane beta-barrel protein n=1 Tax=Kangiella sp. TOML190 TaxID=2931351 RepID=UPI00203CC7CE|nr:TIGR04219 family outer membrane beta-barrel protein [Kangiella sp. TOML190]